MDEKIKIKTIVPEGLPRPEIPRDEDIGIDIYAAEDFYITVGQAALINTQLRMQPPPGWWMKFYDRGSVSEYCAVLAGVIDNYTGFWKVRMFCFNGNDYKPSGACFSFCKGDKIAQAVIHKNWNSKFALDFIDDPKDFYDTSRGEGGFGSTGK